MKKLKSYNQLNEFYNKKISEQLSSKEICSELYKILSVLVQGDYSKAYTMLYDKYDMLYQMFKSDMSVAEFINTVRIAADKEDFYAIYNPINKIITKLIETNIKK